MLASEVEGKRKNARVRLFSIGIQLQTLLPTIPMHCSVKEWVEGNLVQPHLPNSRGSESLRHQMPRASSAQTSTVATSAAKSNYRDVVLASTYHAHFRRVVDFPDQLPRALAAVLGLLRPVSFTTDAAEPASAQQGTTSPSAITLAHAIDKRLRSRRAAFQNETWWNSLVWSVIYGNLTQEDAVLAVE